MVENKMRIEAKENWKQGRADTNLSKGSANAGVTRASLKQVYIKLHVFMLKWTWASCIYYISKY